MKSAIAQLLGSRVGRRLFLLFAVSALVPLAVSAFLSLTQVRTLLLDQGEQRLAAIAKTYGMQIFERLLLASDLVAASARSTNAPAGPDSLAARTFFSIVVQRGENQRRVLGTPRGMSEIPGQVLARAAEGRNTLFMVDDGGMVQLMLAAVLDKGGIAIGELRPEYLFGPIDELPAATDFCVVERAQGKPLFCSAQLEPAMLRMLGSTTESTLPESRYARGDRYYRARTWTQFMRAGFGTPDWAVIASQPEAHQLAPAHQFRDVYLSVVILALLVATWLAIRQSRSVVGPLMRLAERARGVAKNDFATRLGLQRHDEFGELAGAFDQMTDRLGQQFAALRALSEIDQMILSTKETEEVVRAVVELMSEIARADLITVTLFDHQSRLHARTYRQSSEGFAMERHEMAEADLAELAQASATFRGDLRTAPELPAYLMHAKDDGMTAAHVQPILWRSEICGVLVLGFRSDAALTQEQRDHARELSDRVAVAVSSAWRDEQLYRQAHFDPLTGLPNRLLFNDRLEREAARSNRGDNCFAVLFIDLDHFKNVNDSLGHTAGDLVLKDAAKRIAGCVRSSDTVSRFGGDEFAVLLTGLHGPQEAWLIAESIVAAVSGEYDAGGQACFLGASAGVSLFPADGETAEALLKCADTAMYRAKTGGRAQVVFFEERMNSEVVSRVTLDRELREALEKGELELHYQPQVDLASGRVVAAEALLRWKRPGEGYIPPARFIPLAEQSGFIETLGEWVLDRACAQMKVWRASGLPIERISVNVSPRQFRRRSLLTSLRDSLSRHGVPASALEIEITEGLLLEHGDIAESILRELAYAGHSIALDDFGTGFSSMSYLKRLPVDTIKIDRVFVDGLGGGPDSDAIVAAIIAMSHALGKRVIAEGVETRTQLGVLRRLGCDEMQGFLVSPAVEPTRFVQLVTAHLVTEPVVPL